MTENLHNFLTHCLKSLTIKYEHKIVQFRVSTDILKGNIQLYNSITLLYNYITYKGDILKGNIQLYNSKMTNVISKITLLL